MAALSLGAPVRLPPHCPAPAFLAGRAEITTMHSALLLDDAVPLLTLTGPGGVGKTRLALARSPADLAAALCRRAVLRRSRSVRDPALVLPAIAQALGRARAAAGPPRDAERRAPASTTHAAATGQLRTSGRGGPPGAALAGLLPSLHVLATSRAALRSAEQRLAGGPLLCPDPPPRAARASARRCSSLSSGPRPCRPVSARRRQRRRRRLDVRHLDGFRWRSSWPRHG